MVLSEFHCHFGICSFPDDIKPILIYIYHISQSQFIYFYQILKNKKSDIYIPIQKTFLQDIKNHFLSIIDYYGILLQIIPQYLPSIDPMSLFLWYIYKGYNYLEEKDILEDNYAFLKDISQSIDSFSLQDIYNNKKNICPFVSHEYIIQLLLCIQCDPIYTLHNYYIPKNKGSVMFLAYKCNSSDIIETNYSILNDDAHTPSLPNYYHFFSTKNTLEPNENEKIKICNIINEIKSGEDQHIYNIYIFALLYFNHNCFYKSFFYNNPDTIYILPSNYISVHYVNSRYYSSYLLYYYHYINSNKTINDIIISEFLHLIYCSIRNATIVYEEIWINQDINNYLTKLFQQEMTPNIQHYSAIIQLLLKKHKLFSQLDKEHELNEKNDSLFLQKTDSESIQDDCICSLCNKKGGLFVIPVYINNHNQQGDLTTSIYTSIYTLYNSIYYCYHNFVAGGKFIDFSTQSCNHPIHYKCLLKVYLRKGVSMDFTTSCPICGCISNFMIPIFNKDMFYHSTTEIQEKEELIYNKYKHTFDDIKNSHWSFYGVTCSNNSKDIDIYYHMLLSCFMQSNVLSKNKLYISTLYDLFSQSITSIEFNTRLTTITKNQQYLLLYIRNFMFIFLRIYGHSSYLPSHTLYQTSFLHFYVYDTNRYTIINGINDIGSTYKDMPITQYPVRHFYTILDYKYTLHLRLIGNLLDYYYLWNDKTLYNRMKEKENIQRDRELLYVDENEVAFKYINIPIDDYYEEEYQQYIQDMKNSKDIYSEYINELFEIGNTILEPALLNNIRIPYNDFDSIYSPSLEISSSEIENYKLSHYIIDVDIQSRLKDAEMMFRLRENNRKIAYIIIIYLMEELYIYYEDILCYHKQSNIRYIYFLIANIFYILPERPDVSSLPYTIPREYTRLYSLYKKPLGYYEIIKYCYIMEDLLLFKPLLTQMTQNYMSIFSQESLISLLINHSNHSFINNEDSIHNKLLNTNNISFSFYSYRNMMNIMNTPSFSNHNPYIASSIHSILSSSFIDITKTCKFTILNEPEYRYNPDYPVIWNKEKHVKSSDNNIILSNEETPSKSHHNVLSSISSLFNTQSSLNNSFFNELQSLFLQQVPKVFTKEYIEHYKTQLSPFIQISTCTDFFTKVKQFKENQISSDISHYKQPLNYSSIEISSESIIYYMQLFFELYGINNNSLSIYELLYQLFTSEISIKQLFISCSIDPLFVDYLYTLIGFLHSYQECFPSSIHAISHYSLTSFSSLNVYDTPSTYTDTVKQAKIVNKCLVNYLKDCYRMNQPFLSSKNLYTLARNSLIIKPRNIAKEFIDYLFCHFPLGNNEEMTILLYKHFKELYPLIYINNKLMILLQLMIFIRYTPWFDKDISYFFNYAKKWEIRDVYVYEEIPFETEVTHMIIQKGIEYTVEQLSIPFLRTLYLLNIILSPSFSPSMDISIPTSFSSLYTSLSLSSSPSLSSLVERDHCEYIIEEIISVINFDVLDMYSIPDYFFILNFDLEFKEHEYPLLKQFFYLTDKEIKDISFEFTCTLCNHKNYKEICVCVVCGKSICFSIPGKQECMKQYLNDNNNSCHCRIFYQLYTGTIYYIGRENWYIIMGNIHDLLHSLLLKDINIKNKSELELKELAIQEITTLLNRNDICLQEKYTKKMYMLT
ncbi:hypothetical protein WA158_004123 [Blastocystis sp. Blastoise]